MRGNSLTVESGGINEGYVEWLKAREANDAATQVFV